MARWLVAGVVVTVDACSWLSTADCGGPLPASHPYAETSMWHSVRCHAYYGGVALAWAQGLSANLLTVSGVGHTASERSPCVAQLVTLYLVEVGSGR